MIVSIKFVLFGDDAINRVAGDHGDNRMRKKMRRTGQQSIFSLADPFTLSKFPQRRGQGSWSKFLSDCQLRDDVKVFVNVRIDDEVNRTATGGIE
jgi:hypothetical protein